MIGCRNRSMVKWLTVVVAIIITFPLTRTCILFEPDPLLLVKTESVSGEQYTSCSASGIIVHLGEEAISQHGFCWSQQHDPTIDSGDKLELGSRNNSGSFSREINNLESGATYYLRAYATDNLGTVYGAEFSFTTLELSLPSLVTADITSVSDSSAISGGNITDDGGDSVMVRGVCWSTAENPTVEDSITFDGSGLGSFTSSISGLDCGTSFYVRAYATSATGTAYGQQESFTTLSCPEGLATVTTAAVSAISDSSAQCGGEVTDDGGNTVSARGVCWSNELPVSLDDSFTVDGSGTGSYTSSITGLECNTTYYVRAYATNSAGTAYGLIVNFASDTCPVFLPTVTTASIINITENSAQGGGEITDNGGDEVTARGICWSIASGPTTSDSYTSDGTGTGSFTSDLTGLDPATDYYVRAYATNGAGTAYGNEIEFTTQAASNTVIDFDGNEYQVVQIGFQTWMAENLRTTHYSDGSAIPFVEDQATWADFGVADKGYCYYNNDTGYASTYGALYSWAAAMNGAASSHLNPSGVQGVCPTGWHLPSDAEWKQLEMHLGMSQEEADSTGYRGVDLDGKLKETGTVNWKIPNTGATNETGFSARPGGWRNTTGAYLNRTLNGYFWSSTDQGNTQVWFRNLSYSKAEIDRDNYLMNGEGFSVRCVKDGGSITMPIVTTTTVSNITESAALGGGEVTSDGGAAVTAKGICWSKDPDLDPNLSDNHTTDASGTGSYASLLSDLDCSTTYYVRAYATNSTGTAYGNRVSFTTSTCSVFLPTVTTNSITNITGVSAQIEGNVTDDGGAIISARGVCWSTSQEPTLSDSFIVVGSGTGTFTSNISGLTIGTDYYVRAYATNSAGTAYGNQRIFNTDDIPTISTSSVINITDTTAQSGGNVTHTGGATVTAKGVCWSTFSNPTLSDNHTADGTGTGSFTSIMTGLSCGTTYYVRAYATNSIGTAYGSQVTFTTIGCKVTDYDGNSYNIVTIGSQVWMAENLKVTHYSDGSSIFHINNQEMWDTISLFVQGYCWYNDNPSNRDIYGALYNWRAAMNDAASSTNNPSGVQGACPDGWHIPSDAEWKQLEMHLGMHASLTDSTGWRGTDEGGKLKQVGTSLWNSPNTGATNEFDFTALPGGYRVSDGTFNHIGNLGLWWSSSEYNPTDAWYRSLYFNNSAVNRINATKTNGFSVRCVKND